MKRIAILSVLLWAASTTVPAQPKAYFCTTKGMTLRYERYDPDGDRHWWTQTTKVNDIQKQNNGSYIINFTANVKGVKVKSPVKGDVNSTAFIHPDGTVDINISEAVSIAAKQRFSAFDFTASGGTSSLKSTIQPGEKLDEIHGAVEWSGIKYRIDYTARSVTKRETITVPAGTFDCIVVKEHKLEKAPLLKRDRITYTWYALGYGLIRHDTFFTDGRQECTEQLTEIITHN